MPANAGIFIISTESDRRIGGAKRYPSYTLKMTEYRRDHTVGSTWFFTVNLADRQSRILVTHIELLRNSFRDVMRDHPFVIDAIVILPEHLHTIWTLPEGDADYAMRWRLIKTTFSRSIPKGEQTSPSRLQKGERGIWQRRFWEHRIRDEKDFSRHLDYIHINPLKHGHVSRVADWPFSSFHRYVENGIYDREWGGTMGTEGGFGERD